MGDTQRYFIVTKWPIHLLVSKTYQNYLDFQGMLENKIVWIKFFSLRISN